MIDGINTYIPCALACNYPGYRHGTKYQYKERNVNVAVSQVDDEHVKVSVRGSLHKYFNGGKHNANDFTPGMARAAVRDLFGVLRLNPEVMRLGGFEFGVNVPLPFSPDRFINTIIAYSAGERVPIKTPTMKNSLGIVFEYGDYDIKIYNKSTGADVPYRDLNILRVEIKVKRRKVIKNARVDSVSDLMEAVVWKELIGWLRPVIDNLIVYEHGTVDDSGFAPLKKQLFRDGTTVNYWSLCKMDHSRQTYRNKLRSFQKLIDNYTTSTLKERVNGIFQAKLDEVEASLSVPVDTEEPRVNAEETTVNVNNNPINVDNNPGRGSYHRPHDNPDRLITLSTKIRGSLATGERVENVKVCPVTGLDISMQRKESRFLGITGVKFYMKHDPPVRDELFRRLSPRWRDAPPNKQIKEIAHSIRNEYHNPRHNAKKALIRSRCERNTIVYPTG